MDATYNLTGGFMPTVKRNANLDGPGLLSDTAMGDICSYGK